MSILISEHDAYMVTVKCNIFSIIGKSSIKQRAMLSNDISVIVYIVATKNIISEPLVQNSRPSDHRFSLL